MASALEEDLETRSMITPAPSATPPTAKPTVESVAALRIESMSPCALVGQLVLPDLQTESSDDFLLSTLAPKIDPTATPTTPVPIKRYAGKFEEPDDSAPGAAPGIGPL